MILLQYGFTTMAMERRELETGALKMEQLAFKKFLPCIKHILRENCFIYIQIAATRAIG